MEKYRKQANGLRKDHDLSVRYQTKLEKKHFFQNPALSYIKRFIIFRRFPKYELTLVTKCTYHKFFQDDW
jgi:hypothetical protein